MKKRIYVVSSNGADTRLVEAVGRGHAIRYVAAKTIRCDLASQHEIVRLMQGGVKVESAVEPDLSGGEDL